MDPDAEVAFEYLPILRVYKSGRFERYSTIDTVPASLDPSTNVASKDALINPETNVSARLYLPNLSTNNPKKKLPLLVYFHGGGFFTGSASTRSTHNYLNSLVAKANIMAASVDYRLAPEHPLPAAHEDSWQMLQWLASHANGDLHDEWLCKHADFDNVFLGGVSAGANIAHNMAMRASKHGMSIQGMALVHPYFWSTKRLASEMQQGRFLDPVKVEVQWPYLCPGTSGSDDPLINPFAEGAPTLAQLGCKRVLVCVAERDILKDRGKVYCERLKKSGWEGEVELVETEGEDHGFYFRKPDCEQALALMETLVAFLIRE